MKLSKINVFAKDFLLIIYNVQVFNIDTIYLYEYLISESCYFDRNEKFRSVQSEHLQLLVYKLGRALHSSPKWQFVMDDENWEWSWTVQLAGYPGRICRFREFWKSRKAWVCAGQGASCRLDTCYISDWSVRLFSWYNGVPVGLRCILFLVIQRWNFWFLELVS